MNIRRADFFRIILYIARAFSIKKVGKTVRVVYVRAMPRVVDCTGLYKTNNENLKSM